MNKRFVYCFLAAVFAGVQLGIVLLMIKSGTLEAYAIAACSGLLGIYALALMIEMIIQPMENSE